MNSSYSEINKYIDMKGLKILNVTKESDPQDLFGKYLNGVESHADPQILLMISFELF